jgi:metalloendopeptidase OMA1, mitochondrial
MLLILFFQAGLEAYKEIMREYQQKILPPNHPFHRYVETVAQKLLTATGLGHLKGHTPLLSGNSFGDSWDVDSATTEPLSTPEWEVHVIQDDKTPNAFVLPGISIRHSIINF